MKNQTFTVEERQAFFDIYTKCAYCGRLLESVSDMEIDHLIPQSISEITFSKIKKDYHLAVDYSITGYENLVATCSRCNREKGSSTSSLNPLLFTKAKNKTSKIIQRIHSLSRKKSLNKDKSKTTISFELKFKSKIIRGNLSKSKLIDLYDEPVWLGSDDNKDGLELEGHDNEQLPPITVKTVHEYQDAINNGWFPLTTYSIKMSCYFEITKNILSALETAKQPELPYLSDNLFDFSSAFESLPSSLAIPDWIPSEQILINTQEQPFLSNLAGILIIESTVSSLRFELDGAGFYYKELLRGDFKNNGYEQIFCLRSQYAVGGTFGYSNTILIEKKSPNGQIEVLKIE